jgi:hypothetical protein
MSRVLSPNTRFQGLPTIDKKWIDMGLTAFYLTRTNFWNRNLAKGGAADSTNCAMLGANATLGSDYLRTTGVDNQWVKLYLGATYSQVYPMTLLMGCRKISGSVGFSIFKLASPTSGLYGDGSGGFSTTGGEVYDGSISTVAPQYTDDKVNYCAVSLSSTSLRGSKNGGIVAVDDSFTIPTTGNITSCALGGFMKSATNTSTVSSVTDFKYVGFFNKVLPDDLLQSLSKNPWQMFTPLRRMRYFISNKIKLFAEELEEQY